MRKTVVSAMTVLAALSLLATGAQRYVFKVYFTVGTAYGQPTQLWRCNRDGSSSELLLETSSLSVVEIESSTEQMLYVDGSCLYAATLDGTGAVCLDYNIHYTAPDLVVSDHLPVDAKDGYVCWMYGGDSIFTARPDGSDSEYFFLTSIPGMPQDPVVADVAMHVVQSSPVERWSWGRIKAEFR